MEMEKEDIQAIEDAMQFIREHWNTPEGNKITRRLEEICIKYQQAGFKTAREAREAFGAAVVKPPTSTTSEKYRSAIAAKYETPTVRIIGKVRENYHQNQQYRSTIYRLQDSKNPTKPLYGWQLEMKGPAGYTNIGEGHASSIAQAEKEIKQAIQEP